MVTDENANDVVDMAPHRWKKPAQRPIEPLTKNNLLGKKQRSLQFMFSHSQSTHTHVEQFSLISL